VSQPIEDYGLIGDTRTAALVGKNGSIDWLCVPRFDSPAVFAAMVGERENGFWRVAPAGAPAATTRRYRDNTLILETTFHKPEGTVTLVDFMPICEQENRLDLVRIVRGDSGTVEMKSEIALRFGYGRIIPWVKRTDYGLRAIAGPDAVELRSPVRHRGRDFMSEATFTISAGQTLALSFTWYPSHHRSPRDPHPLNLLASTESYWTEWSKGCSRATRWGDAVTRSLITLKALTYAPTGGIVAAPTTSLPETLGGVRNWDYRFCWLRDATFTLYSLLTAGYTEEARLWREWLLRAVAGRHQEMQIMYGIAGERILTERELGWLNGYENSRPVRFGNAAHEQFQLDVYGEVMDAMHVAQRHGLRLDEDAWAVMQVLMDYLETIWQEPDEGIWEVRGPRRHFTHSKVMAWVGVDRAVKAVERYGMRGPVEKWRALRKSIHDDICRNAFDPEKNAFVQYYGAKELDAAVLMIPLVGFLPPSDPRMIGTVQAIGKELHSNGLILRYAGGENIDGVTGGEGAFLPCTFWYADNLSMMGREQEAAEIFTHLLSLANDLGLMAEEYDARSKRMVGNFPQAFTHVSLVNTAFNLDTGLKPAVHRAGR
jgi:GH15 family glucan-1,4-alpha-glucosidase